MGGVGFAGRNGEGSAWKCSGSGWGQAQCRLETPRGLGAGGELRVGGGETGLARGSAEEPSRDKGTEVGTLMLQGAGESLGMMLRRTCWGRRRAVGRAWDRGEDLVWDRAGDHPARLGPGAQVSSVNTVQGEQPWLWAQTWA